jgi:hypothetical protein
MLHQLDPAQHDFLLVELHVRDAVHQQSARTIRALEHRHEMPRLVELCGRGEARRAGADDGDLLARANLGRFRHHPALVPPVIDDRRLDVLDRDGRRVDAEDA